MSGDAGDTPRSVPKKVARARSMAARKAARTRAENTRLEHLWKHERELWRSGYGLIAGVDESGVGPLAGPVVAAAVILPRDFRAPGLWECKRLLADKRPEFWTIIVESATAVGIGVVDVDELDRINIHQAALKAMRLALSRLPVAPDSALVDGFSIPGLEIFQRPIVDGDQYSMSIAAASVVAKVTRDRMMERLDHLYPGYGFANHKGYGTREHRTALAQLGICPIHRRSFEPVMRLVNGGNLDADDRLITDAELDTEASAELDSEAVAVGHDVEADAR